MHSIEQQLDANQSRRMANEDRVIRGWDAVMAREDAAEMMVGKVTRDGKTVHYINVRKASGECNGRTKEGTLPELIDYLIRNNYA